MINWIEKIKTIPRWRKYSQSDEECYIEYILSNIPQKGKQIVELGAWDGYHLSNTRYFIENGYKALLIDGDNRGNEEVVQSFITRDNIVELLKPIDSKSFDLLCIDLDGNDLYILEVILNNGYKPSLVVAEFNPIFDEHESKTIRYNADHAWDNDDYYGFSFAAGQKMANKYGYICIHQNDNLNMYFVREDLIGELDIPKVIYEKTNYHPKSQNTDWIEY